MAGTALRKRAEKRKVEQVGERAWRVLGEDKFGDSYPEYLVTLEVGATKYECACYQHGQGDTRRRKMCSHVLATVLHRKTAPAWNSANNVLPPEPLITDDEDEAPFPTEVSQPKLELIRGEGRDDAPGADGEGPLVAAQRFLSVSSGTLNEIALDPQHEALGDPPIPEEFGTFRPHQWKAILEILKHLEDGVKVVMLSAHGAA